MIWYDTLMKNCFKDWSKSNLGWFEAHSEEPHRLQDLLQGYTVLTPNAYLWNVRPEYFVCYLIPTFNLQLMVPISWIFCSTWKKSTIYEWYYVDFFQKHAESLIDLLSWKKKFTYIILYFCYCDQYLLQVLDRKKHIKKQCTLTLTLFLIYVSCGMKFSTMWYVRPAKPQTSLPIRAVWSEALLVAWMFYEY